MPVTRGAPGLPASRTDIGPATVPDCRQTGRPAAADSARRSEPELTGSAGVGTDGPTFESTTTSAPAASTASGKGSLPLAPVSVAVHSTRRCTGSTALTWPAVITPPVILYSVVTIAPVYQVPDDTDRAVGSTPCTGRLTATEPSEGRSPASV